jgi:two-component system, sensor histidine kinase RegB
MTLAELVTGAAPLPDIGMLRLRTLVRLRWLAVIGQSAAIAIVNFGLGFDLPLSACLLLIALSAWLNIFLTFKWRGNPLLTARQAAVLLGYDVVQLAGLLFLTGGMENPFAFLFLVPVTVSATTLPLVWTLLIGGLTFICATALAFTHYPLPWNLSEPLQLPPTYIFGVWTAVASGSVFAALYARRIAVEARQMSSALSATEMVLAREQRLTALDGLAAAAAHELGTPLATIALVAKELKRELPADTAHRDDIDLLISQAARCREILSKLSSRDQKTDVVYEHVKLTSMLEDLATPLRGSDVAVNITSGGQLTSTEPVFRRNPAITYGLGNLLENAIDFAETVVEVDAQWSDEKVMVTISDDGPGFDQAIFDRLGDPFVTTRPGYDDTGVSPDTAHPGMGLGLFIAKTLLERSGASVTLANRPSPDHGARITMNWPRKAIDVGKVV